MQALQITSMKQFMSQLLTTDVFDTFLLEEATITTGVTYHIEGLQHPEFYQDLEPEDRPGGCHDFVTWSSMRGQIFDLIKGKRAPLHFKIVLHLLPQHVVSILSGGSTSVTPEQVKAFVLTIRYDGEKIMLTTGTSYHTFLLDKEPEKLWDDALTRYLNKKGVPFTSSSWA